MTASPKLLVQVCLLSLGAVGCGATRYAVETDHYRVEFPREWQVVSQGRHDAEPTTFLIPARPQQTTEVRVYAWLERGEVSDPSARVLENLRTEKQGDLHLASVKDSDAAPAMCGGQHPQVELLGATHSTRYLTEADGWMTVIVGGHAEGSLVGVVGRIPMNGQACDNLAALEQNVQLLAHDVTAVCQPRRLARAVAFSPLPGQPDPYLPYLFRE
ncbi:MAG TPA: hypothetical protein VFH73_13725 [Polyangia bacterium]|jgi:hypothetical protein|nr:hypothetical protein [Polyangia bacterium]